MVLIKLLKIEQDISSVGFGAEIQSKKEKDIGKTIKGYYALRFFEIWVNS